MVERQFFPTLARAGMRQVRFHDLRHSYATLLINPGANIKYISKQMGHASVQITLDRYGHLLPDTGAEAMRRLDGVVAEVNDRASAVPAVPGRRGGPEP